MSVYKLKSGRWRAQVYDPRVGRNVSVSRVLPGESSFDTKTQAKQARSRAREAIAAKTADRVTLQAFWERWTTDPLAQPKESANIHNRERTRAFAESYGHLPIAHVGDLVVAEWLKGGMHNGTVSALRAMLNDAASARGGRLISRNPFSRLGMSRGRGRRDLQPPTEQQVWGLIEAARKVACPSFAAWLQVAAFTGMRPGEVDALRWANVDLSTSRIFVADQFSAASKTSRCRRMARLATLP